MTFDIRSHRYSALPAPSSHQTIGRRGTGREEDIPEFALPGALEDKQQPDPEQKQARSETPRQAKAIDEPSQANRERRQSMGASEKSRIEPESKPTIAPEKTSSQPVAPVATKKGQSAQSPSQHPANKDVKVHTKADGMAAAFHRLRMLQQPSSKQNQPDPLTGADGRQMPRQLIRAAALVQPLRKQVEPARREERPLPVGESTGPRTDPGQPQSVQRAEAPHAPHDINPLLVRAMERMKETGHNTLRLSLRTLSGALVAVKIELRNDRVRARFETDDRDLRHSIEQGWASLIREAASKGIEVSPPLFGDEQSTTATGERYA